MSNQQTIQADWLSKSFAVVVLGLVIAVGCSGFFMLLPFAINPSFKAQLAMWLITPIWFSIIGFGYLFQSGKKAWISLSALSVVIWLLYMLIKLI